MSLGRAQAWDDADVLPYATYLRAYEPLSAFPEPDRSAWASYADCGSHPSRGAALDVEHVRALRHLVSVPQVVAPEAESRDAYLRRVDGVTYVCPWETRLRSWLALTEFQSGMPERIAGTFLPKVVADQAAGDFERYKRDHRSEHPHILTSTWHVPPAWFVAFDSAERWLVLGDPDAPPGKRPGAATAVRTLVYVTRMSQARRRVACAVAVIRRRLGEGAAYAELERVGRWLEDFHPRSLVELDYGGLVHLLDDESLRDDQSVADVAAALTALEADDRETAAAAYERLTASWRRVRRLEAAN